MATGYLVESTCFATEQEAVDAYYSSAKKTFLGTLPSGQFYSYQTERDSTGTWLYVFTYNCSSGCITDSWIAPRNIYGSCTLSPANDPINAFVDGHILGWGVALAMAAAWGIHILRRAAT